MHTTKMSERIQKTLRRKLRKAGAMFIAEDAPSLPVQLNGVPDIRPRQQPVSVFHGLQRGRQQITFAPRHLAPFGMDCGDYGLDHL